MRAHVCSHMRMRVSAHTRRHTRHPVVHTGHALRWAQGDSITVARAPGRLDVLGGISDYSGSLVLQQPTAEASHAAVQLRVPSGVAPGALHRNAYLR